MMGSLEILGQKIAQLRYRQQLKQSDLARDAGVSLRTLQRLEAGEIVKTDAMLKVLKRLSRLEEVLGALALSELSPYEQLEQAGLKPADLGKRKATGALSRVPPTRSKARTQSGKKRRVRRPVSKIGDRAVSAGTPKKASGFQWPEDQAS
jgi:transcriptional regulator with XRE-family HTH domain